MKTVKLVVCLTLLLGLNGALSSVGHTQDTNLEFHTSAESELEKPGNNSSASCPSTTHYCGCDVLIDNSRKRHGTDVFPTEEDCNDYCDSINDPNITCGTTANCCLNVI